MKFIQQFTMQALCLVSLSAQTPTRLYSEAISDDQQFLRSDSKKWSAAPHSYEKLVSAPATLIPFPREVIWTKGLGLRLEGKVSIFMNDASLETSAFALAETFKHYGIVITKSSEQASDFSIKLVPEKVTQAEGYHLTITNTGCSILAHDAAGAFYAVQTLAQMLSQSDGKLNLAACKIVDYPAFKIRGFMHDTGRNFQTIGSLKKQIDRFADYKLNVFHWHLTDHPAWRIESKLFPELNDPKNRRQGRDPELTYSFDQIRELIAYAKQRHVMIIPELDMPGHSQYFEKTFGFKMGTSEGMEVLEKLIDEFCLEIPATDCPYLHLGADEVKIPDPDAFIKRMSLKVRANKRIPILWNPGLKPTDEQSIQQLWNHSEYKETLTESRNPIIDSAGGYINNMDPQRSVMKYFFWQACNRPESDDRALGGILCHWPDVRVDDKENIFKHSPVWPALLAFSESIWQGRSKSTNKYMYQSPPKGTDAWMFLREFEARIADHRDRYFADEYFPYVKQSGIEWEVSQAYPHTEGEPWTQSFEPETDYGNVTGNGGKVSWSPLNGASVSLPRKESPVPSTRYLRSYLHSETDRDAYLMVGYDTPRRFKRRGPGVPKQGQWDANGGSIWFNGEELIPPVWNNPGKFRNERLKGLSKEAHETPFTDEEFYWCREPVKVHLKKGPNLILMRVPYVYKEQSYQAICVPVKKHNSRWVEDETLTSQRTKE